MIRRLFVWLHRYVGLVMAAFLVFVGATGAVLAFKDEVESLVAPQLYAAAPVPAPPRLDVASLAEKAEQHEPKARIAYFFVYPRQVVVECVPRIDQTTGRPFNLDFDEMFLDPWTGKELARRKWGDLSQGRVNVIPFIYDLHESLALGGWGAYALGVTALMWTVDAFYALYLTFPLSTKHFWRRWRPAWCVKRRPGMLRLNFDLHRAGGLWFWPLILIFGWSSLMWNLPQVYAPVMGALFDSVSEIAPSLDKPNLIPRLSWREAQAISARTVAEEARREGFALGEAGMFGYMAELGAYTYGVQSSLDVQRRAWNTGIWIDGDTGKLIRDFRPTGQHAGNTVGWWLRALHFADLYGCMAYRVLVCVFGGVIVVSSVTGIYIWWKKHAARCHAKRTSRMVTLRE